MHVAKGYIQFVLRGPRGYLQSTFEILDSDLQYQKTNISCVYTNNTKDKSGQAIVW